MRRIATTHQLEMRAMEKNRSMIYFYSKSADGIIVCNYFRNEFQHADPEEFMNEKEIIMKKAGRKISLCMGITLSFFLSLIGLASSGKFTLSGWLISFVISTVISLVIGFIVPIKKVNDAACTKLGLIPGRLSTRCFESLLSDLIFTPIITFCMVYLAFSKAVSMGAPVRFLPMFLHSLAICMIAGFILIFIFTPLFVKLIIRPQKNGKAV